MSRELFMVEGEWSGYTSSQRRVVHREYASRKRAEAIRQLGRIRYADGTVLVLRVSEYHAARGQQRPSPINGYGSLIEDCIAAGVNSVDALINSQAKAGA